MARAIVSAAAPRADAAAEATAADDDAAYVHVQALRELFGLDPARSPTRRGASPAPRSPSSSRAAGAAALSRGARSRLGHPRQRAGAGAGAAWSRARSRRTRVEVELVEIKTSGDDAGGPAPVRRQGALREGDRGGAARRRIDLAVHSAKDVPGRAARAGLAIVGRARARPTPRDALCGAARRSTRSPRAPWWAPRACAARSQLLALRPDLDVREVRGNVDTRLRQARRRASTTRSCWPPPACAGWAAARGRTPMPERRRSTPPPARAAWRSRRAPTTTRRAGSPGALTDRARARWADGRARGGHRAGRDLRHAGRRARDARGRRRSIRLDAFAALPDGIELDPRRVEGMAADRPGGRPRRWPTGSLPPAPARSLRDAVSGG